MLKFAYRNKTEQKYVHALGLQSDPFSDAAAGEALFQDNTTSETYKLVSNLLTRASKLVVILGDNDSGKTTLHYQLEEQFNKHFRVVRASCSARMKPERFLVLLANEFNINADSTIRLRERIQNKMREVYSSGQTLMVLLDDAETLPAETCELLLTLNQDASAPIKLALFATPELGESINKARVPLLPGNNCHLIHLRAYSFEQTTAYIQHRLEGAGVLTPLLLTDAQLARIHKVSKGLPGKINYHSRNLLKSPKTIQQVRAMLHLEPLATPTNMGQMLVTTLFGSTLAKIVSGSSMVLVVVLLSVYFRAYKFTQAPAYHIENRREPSDTVWTTIQDPFTQRTAKPEKRRKKVESTPPAAEHNLKTAPTLTNEKDTTKPASVANSVETQSKKEQPPVEKPKPSIPPSTITRVDAPTEKLALPSTATRIDTPTEQSTPPRVTNHPVVPAEKPAAQIKKAQPTVSEVLVTGDEATTDLPNPTVATTAVLPKNSENINAEAEEDEENEETVTVPTTNTMTVDISTRTAPEIKNDDQQKQWVLDQNPKSYTLMLYTAATKTAADDFIKQHKIGKDFAYYPLRYQNRTWYHLVHGVFLTRDAAKAQLKQLANLEQGARVRKFQYVQKEMRAGTLVTGKHRKKNR